MTDTLTIAVTGATGFLGGHVIRAARDRGHHVRALSRNPKPLGSDDGVRWITGTLEDKAGLAELVSGADVVVHAAGAIKALSRDAFFRVNRDGTRAVADAAAHAGVKRFVLVSSLAAREEKLSPYAASKRAAEMVADEYAQKFDTVILRPPAIYGPGDQETVRLFQMAVNGFLIAPGSADARMSLVHVGDVAEAVLVCCQGDQGPAPLEIDDGKAGGYSWQDLADAASKGVDRPTKLVHLPNIFVWVMGFVGSLKALLTRSPAMLTLGKVPELRHRDWVAAGPRPEGWQPNWGLEAGFKDAIDWYCSQNVLKRYF